MTLLRMLAFRCNDTSTTKKTLNISAPNASNNASITTQPNAQLDTSTSWQDLILKLQLSGPTLALAKQCSIKEFTEKKLHLTLHPKHSAFLNNKNVERINNALHEHYSKKITTEITIEESAAETPAEQQQRIQRERCEQAEQSIDDDKTVSKDSKNL